jgi:hypothetical protein
MALGRIPILDGKRADIDLVYQVGDFAHISELYHAKKMGN